MTAAIEERIKEELKQEMMNGDNDDDDDDDRERVECTAAGQQRATSTPYTRSLFEVEPFYRSVRFGTLGVRERASRRHVPERAGRTVACAAAEVTRLAASKTVK